MSSLTIEKLLTIDETGMPKAPSIRQLQDKDVALLWQRDTTKDKRKYIAEVGVIYYLEDPKSTVKQRGLSDSECLKEAINNYNLPKDYTIDPLVKKLIGKYYTENITEAGVAIEVLQKSIHLVTISANKINDQLTEKLSGAISQEDISTILNLSDAVSKRIAEIPNLTKALLIAKENLKEEQTQQVARGGVTIVSSMDANETI